MCFCLDKDIIKTVKFTSEETGNILIMNKYLDGQIGIYSYYEKNGKIATSPEFLLGYEAQDFLLNSLEDLCGYVLPEW